MSDPGRKKSATFADHASKGAALILLLVFAGQALRAAGPEDLSALFSHLGLKTGLRAAASAAARGAHGCGRADAKFAGAVRLP